MRNITGKCRKPRGRDHKKPGQEAAQKEQKASCIVLTVE